MNKTGYKTVNSNIVIKTVSVISTITLDTTPTTSTPDRHYIVLSDDSLYTTGMEIILDINAADRLRTSISVESDPKDVHVFKKVYRALLPTAKSEYTKNNITTTLHSYTVITKHDIALIKLK